VTGYVHDEKPLWVTTTDAGRVTVVGGASGDAVTAGIYVFPEKVRQLVIPSSLDRLRDFLAWLVESGEPIEAVDIPKVVDLDRAEDLAVAEKLAAGGPSLSRRERAGVRGKGAQKRPSAGACTASSPTRPAARRTTRRSFAPPLESSRGSASPWR